MKTKIVVLSFFLGILCFACEDTLDSVGLGIQPKEDRIDVFDTIMNINATTIKIDSFYVFRSAYPLLGNFYDSEYGNIMADYICQYYPTFGFDTTKMVDNRIDSVRLIIKYASYIGDSLAPMEVTVYPVIKPFDGNYSNANPEIYCDMANPWGRKVYTACDLTIPDSIRKGLDFYPEINIPLPVSVGEKLLSIYKAKKAFNLTALPLDEFAALFPGTYVKSTFGTGNLLRTDYTEILSYYTVKYTTEGGEERDTVAYSTLKLSAELAQLNHIRSTKDLDLLKANDSIMYIKSLSGIYPEITIPVSDIVNSIGKRKFSSVKLKINAYPASERLYPIPMPGANSTTTLRAKLLLIERDSLASFFETHQFVNSQTNFAAAYASSTASYNFDNISNLIQKAINRPVEPGGRIKDLTLVLVPIQSEYSTDTGQEFPPQHYMIPSAVKLRKGGNNLQIKVIASDLEINTQ
jgi:hypothetical protein